jgi:hypothetical protein
MRQAEHHPGLADARRAVKARALGSAVAEQEKCGGDPAISEFEGRKPEVAALAAAKESREHGETRWVGRVGRRPATMDLPKEVVLANWRSQTRRRRATLRTAHDPKRVDWQMKLLNSGKI